MKSTDQIGSTHSFSDIPERIVSLVPSLTEMLCDLGLRERLVGCTKFCVHPKGLKREVEVIGGTKSVNIDKVKNLNPDIVLANKEENEKEAIYSLKGYCPVWVSDITEESDTLNVIKELGRIFQMEKVSDKINSRLTEAMSSLPQLEGSVAYIIWKDPYMTVGGDTYIQYMLTQMGLTNVYQSHTRYPEIDVNELIEMKPDYVFLSSEPYPFRQKHADALSVSMPDTKMILVDGEFFSWYGTRLLHLENYGEQLLNMTSSLTI